MLKRATKIRYQGWIERACCNQAATSGRHLGYVAMVVARNEMRRILRFTAAALALLAELSPLAGLAAQAPSQRALVRAIVLADAHHGKSHRFERRYKQGGECLGSLQGVL